MNPITRRATSFALALVITLALALSPGAETGKGGKNGSTGPDSVVVLIGNRMFPDFGEIISTPLHRRHPVGDSEFSFEVVKFYPHFSIIDSTKSIVSVSDEPKNPAFRIKVFKAEALVDSTWAFFNLDIPHFSRTSALWFRVLAFDYRGERFQREPAKTPETAGGRK